MYRLGAGEWRITYAVEEDRLTVLVLEIAPKQRPERYRLTEEMDQTLWLEEMVDSEQESRAKMEERLRVSLLYYAFKAFRDRVEFSDLVKDFDQEQASALIFDLSPQTREKLHKLKEDLEKTLAELADEELREQQTNPERIRVLIVDDMPETRENLRKLLFFESDIEVVGAATSGEEAIQMAVEQQPDIVLMDFLLPGLFVLYLSN